MVDFTKPSGVGEAIAIIDELEMELTTLRTRNVVLEKWGREVALYWKGAADGYMEKKLYAQARTLGLVEE